MNTEQFTDPMAPTIELVKRVRECCERVEQANADRTRLDRYTSMVALGEAIEALKADQTFWLFSKKVPGPLAVNPKAGSGE